MYKIKNEQGKPTYKVDIFSRNQVGAAQRIPAGLPIPVLTWIWTAS
jgi:hypothetical protein